MAHTVELGEGGGYVGVRLTGDLTIGELENARRDLGELLAANGLTRVLIDAAGSTPTQSVSEDYGFTSQHAMHFHPGARVAVLHRLEEAEHAKFFETVAQNRGVNMHVFFDRAEALDWLLER